MKNYFRWFILVLTASTLFTHIPLANSQNIQSQTTRKEPSLVCESKNILFFFQDKEAVLPQNLVCENQGNAPLLIQGVSFAKTPDSSFFVQPLLQKQILPGKRVPLQISFKPISSDQNLYQNELILASNDPQNPFLHFPIQAEKKKTPLIVLHKNKDGFLEPISSLDFGKVIAGRTKTEDLFLRKIGDAKRSKFSISIEGPQADAFGIHTEADLSSIAMEERIVVFFKPSEDKEDQVLSASLHIPYLIEQVGQTQKGEIVIDPLSGFVQTNFLFQRATHPKPSSGPETESYSRFSLAFDIGPGGIWLPSEEGGNHFQANTFGKLKGLFSVFPHPTRGVPHSLISPTDFDIRIGPYLDFGYLSQSYYAPIGVGLEIDYPIFPGTKQLFSLGLVGSLGYNYFPQASVANLSQHYFKMSFGGEFSFGLDAVSQVKGFDLYVSALFDLLAPSRNRSLPGLGAGFHIPFGVRYNFY